ncbi:hypothetical protein FMM05_17815 [Flavobacterium zepuense]|uniref:Imelysin-like domain-containing protein n=1 Tax=Flavobacterium zepuense TaxID=2593302 RepID=A0A552UVU8_9FLAO|nr:imelysin family protein [Flavobacterium zepuense]TRW22363.1 hypothetical protein FMM05_17815 [Flavobacterium zepuense]
MRKISLSLTLLAVTGLFVGACSNDDDKGAEPQGTSKAAVIENYADIVAANYQAALTDAQELETAINAFTANPTDAGFDEARKKWKDARESYGTTEAFRFANGPIDDENGPEGLLNAWPLDESFIDYTDNSGDLYNGGIINNPEIYPSITKDLLIELNESADEKSISVGYHAIEFLLWGQDLTDPSANQPGQREYTDFVDNGTHDNQARRRQYLSICADLLTDHLTYLVDLWKEGGSYRATFLALDEDTALQNILLGITTLAQAELAIERMDVALGNANQEDEHSCFSDNTHRDIALNLQGVINVYEGKYGNIDGPSIADLVQESNSPFYDDTEDAIEAAQSAVAAIATPFDYAISGGPDSPEGAKVKTAVTRLQTLGANFIAGASAIGIAVNPE